MWGEGMDMLRRLGPSRENFEIWGEVVMDESLVLGYEDGEEEDFSQVPPSERKGKGKENGQHTASKGDGAVLTLADLVRSEALGGFVHACVEEIEAQERGIALELRDEQGQGRNSWAGDDGLQQAIIQVCFFSPATT
jgi:hypothetical protein